MGQVTQFFQPPLYWQQFEDLTQSVVEIVYGVAMADKIGRPGQAQDLSIGCRNPLPIRFSRDQFAARVLGILDRDANENDFSRIQHWLTENIAQLRREIVRVEECFGWLPHDRMTISPAVEWQNQFVGSLVPCFSGSAHFPASLPHSRSTQHREGAIG